jgi:hypothetical protein
MHNDKDNEKEDSNGNGGTAESESVVPRAVAMRSTRTHSGEVRAGLNLQLFAGGKRLKSCSEIPGVLQGPLVCQLSVIMHLYTHSTIFFSNSYFADVLCYTLFYNIYCYDMLYMQAAGRCQRVRTDAVRR